MTEHDKDAHVPTDGCAIDPAKGVATVTVRKVAPTIAAQHLSFTARLHAYRGDPDRLATL